MIYEGQFENDVLNGFGRRIWSDGHYKVGWYRNNQLHGYGKKVLSSGVSFEGFYEEDGHEPLEKSNIKMYDTSSFIAQEIKWERYIINEDNPATEDNSNGHQQIVPSQNSKCGRFERYSYCVHHEDK